jgi:hypothetical protein
VRAYLVLSLLAIVAEELRLIDLPRLLGWRGALAIIIALALVPTVMERIEVCPSCRSRRIEIVPRDRLEVGSELQSPR